MFLRSNTALPAILLVLGATLGCSREIEVPEDNRWLEPYLEQSTNIDTIALVEQCPAAATDEIRNEACVGEGSGTQSQTLNSSRIVDRVGGDSVAPGVGQTLESAYRCQVLRQQVIANNLANQSTVAFKRRRAVLGDVAPREILPGGVLDAAGQSTAIGVEIGQGCQVLGTQADFRQGTLVRTGRSLDLAIDGPGFFQVADSDGTVLYTRAGALSINAIGSLVVGSALTGRLLEPTIVIPQNALDVVIKPSGRVQVRMPGQALRSDIGQIQLAFFLNCEGLRPVGENLFAQTDACGPPTTDNPGYNGLGKLRQHTLEQSNVDVGDERQEFADCTRQMRQLRRLLNLVGWKEESAVSGEGVNSD